MHALSATSNQPDWYSRRIATIRQSDLKYIHHWAYDRSLKADGFNAHGFIGPEAAAETHDQRFFMRESSTRQPQAITGDIPPIRYAQFIASRHQNPGRPEAFFPAINGHQM